MASVFRAGYGPQQALSSRYITFAVYIPIALLNIIPIIAEDLREISATIRRYLDANPRLARRVHARSIFPDVSGRDPLLLLHALRCRQGKATLLMVNVLPDNPLIADTVGNPADVKADAPVLNEMGYLDPPLISANDAAQLIARDIGAEAPIYGSLDGSYPRDNLIHLVGWAFNRRMGRVADGVFLTYESPEKRQVIFAAARMNYDRKDVAAHFDNPDYEWAGWEAKFHRACCPPDSRRSPSAPGLWTQIRPGPTRSPTAASFAADFCSLAPSFSFGTMRVRVRSVLFSNFRKTAIT